ncbi:thiol-disulfide isomerase/thioredoxin [Nocardioides zeae]|uniref:Thiol-disulfide isomerase/thioredoxin n=2 Tax=Nocardioides zeae TaxID=1457234 RepID=A0AAJ1U5K8_9ACTN|nr:thioredoxin family protein [Nocardioides zeae]MDQ1104906.1 thiol-disulfide isomerase/thioredoxin [Nocardioides zeae]MDR6175380.1 thiol-disulfide isomerase/thioredoxin [Nocardioides zeae]MDR6208313.1 thiol-disulfide isomerase/thioredoxin [Nocardioides zeae]
MTGVVILIAAVVLALGFGAWRARVDGRFAARRTPRAIATPTENPTGTEPTGPTAWDAVVAAGLVETPGERATLLQFSSAFCAPCRATRRVLGEVAEVVPGVAHVEVDAEHHLELTRTLGILRTPTTLVLDAAGREVTRAAGAPTKQQVLAGLDAAV